MLHVLGQVDVGHPTGPEFSLDGVAAGEGGLQTFQHVSHGDGSRLATGLDYDLGLGTARVQRCTLKGLRRFPLAAFASI
jgi:hypothetical protein